MTTIYEVWRSKTCDSEWYRNFGDAIMAAWKIFVVDSKGVEVDFRECWSRLMEESWIEGFCAVAAIEVNEDFR